MKSRNKKNNVEPAKRSIYVRPNPSKRQVGDKLMKKDISNKNVGPTKQTGLGVKRYNKKAVQSSGYGRASAYKSVGWTGSAAATHAGTHITGDDTMVREEQFIFMLTSVFESCLETCCFKFYSPKLS